MVYDINGHTASTDAPVGASDYLLIYDASNTAQRKILFDNAAKGNRSIVLTAAGGSGTVTGGCTGPTKIEIGTYADNTYVLDFVGTANTATWAFWSFVLPDSYDGGTMTAKYFWTANSATANAVVWSIDIMTYGDSDLFGGVEFPAVVSTTDTHSGTAYDVNISAASSAITLGGTPAGGKLTSVLVERNKNDAADTLTDTARLFAVILEYGINKWSD